MLVWQVSQKGSAWRVDEEPLLILSGHHDEVTSLAINQELDVVISASRVRLPFSL